MLKYHCRREEVIDLLRGLLLEKIEVPDHVLENSGRQMTREYQEKLMQHILWHLTKSYVIPNPVANLLTLLKSVKYLGAGVRCLVQRKLEVPVLDATAIGVSLLRSDFSTAGSVMFMLGIGELLEEWTHKKSVGDLARSMSLNVSKVWLKTGNKEVLVETNRIQAGDQIVVHMGNLIPFDGTVLKGEAMVNQASLTGESEPVRKAKDSYVYAGTVVEEGEPIFEVKEAIGSSKYEKIVTMIENSEKLKSSAEGKAAHLADKLVPYTFLGTGLVWILTRNVTRTLSVLMVDFSCALKLAMPISVLSAIREANDYHATVKGGKYLEALAEANTIVFDKTGTLTKAQPTVCEVVTFDGRDADEMLRMAACLEEHFPHSIAKAVVKSAHQKGLDHEEMHSKVEHIVAHGIASYVQDQRVVIGSHHFVFEDEKCQVSKEDRARYEAIRQDCSHLYLAINGKLQAVICIKDPLREDAPEVIRRLHEIGFEKIVMMTGDSERTAAIARRIGVDEYHSEVLPEDKAAFIVKEKEAGRKVVMIGDGINDSPALSAADVGMAISDGAAIAREIADITVEADNLNTVVDLRLLSRAMLCRLDRNYKMIMSINGALIVLGVASLIQPTTSALLHNASTIAISINSMKKLLEDEER